MQRVEAGSLLGRFFFRLKVFLSYTYEYLCDFVGGRTVFHFKSETIKLLDYGLLQAAFRHSLNCGHSPEIVRRS